MFLKMSSQDEIVAELERNLKRATATPVIEKIARQSQAVKHLLAAADLLDKVGLTKQADQIATVLETFAWEIPPQNSPSPEEMLRNLEDHGTVFPIPPADIVPIHGKEELVPGKVEKHVEHENNVSTSKEPHDEHCADAPETVANDANANEAKDGEILEVVAPDKDEEVELQPDGDIEVSDDDNKASAAE